MSRNAAQADRRRVELARMLSAGRDVSTVEAADRLGVSEMTIRRDLRRLEEAGMAVRCYGGAVAAQRITFEFAFDRRRRRHGPEKRRIGAAAAATVQPGQTVVLDTGTTTLEIARALAPRDVPCRVVTSSLVVAGELWARRGIELLLLGGRVREPSPDLVGPATEVMLERLTGDVAFLGSDGIDPARGGFAEDIEAARVAERMAAGARRVVVVADHSKLGGAGRARYVTIEDIDEVITGRQADPARVSALRRAQVKVTLV